MLRKEKLKASHTALIASAVTFSLIIGAALAPIDGQSGQGFGRFLGRFHILILHFPVVCLVLAALSALSGKLTKSSFLKNVTPPLVFLSAVTAVFTVICGLLLASYEGHSGALVERHMRRGVSVAVLAVIAAALQFTDFTSLNHKAARWMRAAFAITLTFATSLMFLTAHDGGTLVHGESYLTAYAPKPIRSLFAKKEKAKTDDAAVTGKALVSNATLNQFHNSINPIIKSTCSRCHGSGKEEGGLRFDKLDPAFGMEKDIAMWQRVQNALNTYHMPPKEAKQPSDEDRQALINWIENAKSEAAESQLKSSGPSPMRRLTGFEYNNTLGDLFGTQATFTKNLPPDPIGHSGYSRNSSVLALSALQLEFYLDIARKAVDRYVLFDTAPVERAYFFHDMEDVHPYIFAPKERWASSAQPLSKAEYKKEITRRQSDNYTPVFGRDLGPFPLKKRMDRTTRKDFMFSYNDMMPVNIMAPPKQTQLVPGDIIVRVHAAATEGKDGAWPRMQVNLSTLANRDLIETVLGETDVKASKTSPGVYEFRGRVDDAIVMPPESTSFRLVGRIPHIVISNVSRHEKLTLARFPTGSADKRPQEKRSHERFEKGMKAIRKLKPNLLHIDAIEVEYIPLGSDLENTKWQVNAETLEQEGPSSPTFRAFLEKFMIESFRRNLSPGELDKTFSLYSSLIDEGLSAQEAARDTLASVLISPEFLFIGTPTAREQDKALASKLSYFLWGSAPDEDLRKLAAKGTLSDPAILAKQVKRMLKNPKSSRFTEDFVTQWLRLDRFARVFVMEEYYPTYDDQLAHDMKAETVGLFTKVFQDSLDARTLIKPEFAVLNERLAKHYDINDVKGGDMRPVPTESANDRGGILRQAAFLTINSNGVDSHPVRRGVWIKDRLLADPPPPPPNVDTDLSDEPSLTGLPLRKQLELHRQLPACKSCHERIDPWGVALENFDATGGWRTETIVQNGEEETRFAVEAGTVLPMGLEIESIDALEDYLANDPEEKFTRAITHHMLTYALGRDLNLADKAEIDSLHAQFRSSGYQLSTLALAIAQSNAFRR